MSSATIRVESPYVYKYSIWFRLIQNIFGKVFGFLFPEPSVIL
jgi:hypothetical protein